MKLRCLQAFPSLERGQVFSHTTAHILRSADIGDQLPVFQHLFSPVSGTLSDLAAEFFRVKAIKKVGKT